MTKYRRLFSLAFFLLSCGLCFGQFKKQHQSSDKVIIQYDDGSVFVGKVIDEGPLTMKIVLITEDTITLNKTYIKRIKRSDKNISFYDGAKFHYTKGMFFSLHLGGNFNEFDNTTNQVDMIFGYRFSKKLATGVGFGSYENSTFSFGTWIQATSIPVFAYARYYPFDVKVRPFIAGRAGWGFGSQSAFNGDHSGGALFQPEIGVNFSSRRRFRFLLSIGQQLQHIKGELTDFDAFGNRIQSKYNLWFNRTVLKVGFEWK